jgi:enamine deaminase RidA (YjgF/YER057c/UK114 family)
MPKKEGIQVNLAAANPNLSPATRFGNLLFVAGQTGRHPVSGEVGNKSARVKSLPLVCTDEMLSWSIG